jgi:hypothetical protein
VAAFVASAGATRAESADVSGADRRKLLESVLENASMDARRTRLSTAAAQGLLGAATLTPGVVLTARGDEELRFIGVGFVVAGSIELLTVPLLLIPAPVERIHDRFVARDSGAGVDRVESELQEAALRGRARRPVVGAINAAVGVAALASGMTMLLAPPGIASMARQTQYDWGAALVGMGGPFVVTGIRSLLQRSLEESAWATYADAASSGARGSLPGGTPPGGTLPGGTPPGGTVSWSIVPSLGGAVVRLEF